VKLDLLKTDDLPTIEPPRTGESILIIAVCAAIFMVLGAAIFFAGFFAALRMLPK